MRTISRNEMQTDTPTDQLHQAPRELAELLFRYYQILKQDMLMQMGSFKNHVRNGQIIGTILITTSSFLLGSKNFSISNDNKYIWVIVALAATTITYYLIYDILEANFAVKALEEYLSFLEMEVNKVLGANTLIWQSCVVEKLWPMSKDGDRIISPIKCLAFYGM